jgi:hypothetical protein
MKGIPYGYCQCGCGGKTTIPTVNNAYNGRQKGVPVSFISGHNSRERIGPKNHSWKGGRCVDGRGYIRVMAPTHPKAYRDGYVMEHILVAEKVLGKLLPPGAVVHHINGIKADNRPENLLICQDNAYHIFLHRRMNAKLVCGHANWLKCPYCKNYDSPENMYVYREGNAGFHRKCQQEYRRRCRDMRAKSPSYADQWGGVV